MKMNFRIGRFFFLVLLSVLLMNGCREKESQSNVVVLESTQNEPLKIGKPTQIIKLETTKVSQLGYIYKTVIDRQNNRIFVLSDFNVFIFDGEGHFIAKLHKGKGPGEISMIVSFSLNGTKQVFYAMDNSERLCVFDYNGKFIKDYHLRDFYAINVQSIENDQVLLHRFLGDGRKDEHHLVGLFNMSDEEVTQKFMSEEESPYPRNLMVLQNVFTVNGDRLFFACSNVLGLFEWKNNQFEKILSFDFGKKKVPASFAEKYFAPNNRYNLRNAAINQGYASFLHNSFYFKGHYWVIIEDRHKSCYAIDANNYHKVYMDGPVSAYFGLPEVKSLRYPREMTKNYMVFACSPTDFFDADDTETTKTITIGDKQVQIDMNENPFLIVAE